jgi:hypothetical protein
MAITYRSGLAYGVFKCSDRRPKAVLLARFKQALENVKLAHEETGIPPETEFSVFDVREGMKFALSVDGADGLGEKVVPMEKQGANFMIRSSLPDAPNAIAARDLGDALNMLYGATELFDAENEGREKLVIDVFYRHKSGVYASWLATQMAND